MTIHPYTHFSAAPAEKNVSSSESSIKENSTYESNASKQTDNQRDNTSTGIAARSLMRIPEENLLNVMSFCGLNALLSFEQTNRMAYLKIEKIWLRRIANYNLFVGVTRNSITDDLKFHTFFRIDNVNTAEEFIPCPGLYSKCLNQQVNNLVQTMNRCILSDLLPYVSRQASNTMQVSTCQPDPLISSRSQNVPWKRIYMQIRITLIETCKTPELTTLSPSKINSLTRFAAQAFYMLNRALGRKHFELFNLLESYRFTILTDTKSRFYNVATYISDINFLLFYEISWERPPILEHLIAILSEKRLEISFTGTKTLPCVAPSVFQEEDKKMSEEASLTQLIINKKFDSADFKNWPFHNDYNGKTPLKYALLLANKKTQDFWNEHRRKLEPRENPYLDIIKVLIAAKANVNEPGLMHSAASQVHGFNILNLLIEGKANVNQSHLGISVLEQVLNPDIAMDRQVAHSIIRRVIEAKADINCRNARQRTPLMVATVRCVNETFKLFLQQGPDRSLYDINGNTALMLALEKPGNAKKITWLLSSQVMPSTSGGRRNIQSMSQADINHVNNQGHTALSIAIWYHHWATESYVKLLLKAGADVRLIPPGLNIPAHIAALFPTDQPENSDTKGKKRKNDD
jgi:ankyrin repeat protein